MIDTHDISFIVRGKNIVLQTEKCINSIRKYFPESKIIFSTYEKENIAKLNFDEVIYSKDPGGEKLPGKEINNINRILLTTKIALETVITKYCVVLRSDMIFDSGKLLKNIGNNFPKRNKLYTISKNRLVFYNLFTRKEETIKGHSFPQIFYLSDWFVFGLTDDVKNYFNKSSFTKEPSFSNYFIRNKHKILKNYPRKFAPEQYSAINYFSYYFPEIKLKNRLDFSEYLRELSDKLITNNMIIASYQELGVFIQKKQYLKFSKDIRNTNILNWSKGIISYKDFMSDYQKYCDPDFKIPLRYCYEELLKISQYKEKFYKHRYAVAEKKKTKKKIEEGLKCLSYGLLIFFKSLFRLHKIIFR